VAGGRSTLVAAAGPPSSSCLFRDPAGGASLRRDIKPLIPDPRSATGWSSLLLFLFRIELNPDDSHARRARDRDPRRNFAVLLSARYQEERDAGCGHPSGRSS